MNNRIRIGKVNFAAFYRGQLFSEWDERIKRRHKGYVCFCEAHLWVRAEQDPTVAEALSRAAYVLPDGVAIIHAGRLFGRKFPERQPGPSLIIDFCRHGLRHGYRHFFYGGAEGVAEELRNKLCLEMPELQVAGTYSPPFHSLSEPEKEQIVTMINASGADVVWVGLGAPKQELWMQEFQERLNAPLLMGVGAAFDFHTGRQQWAPRWIRRIGFEWLFRATTGGKKVFFRYLKHVPLFIGLVVKTKLKNK